MPTTRLASSPLVSDRSPVEIFYRDEGDSDGPPLVLLHGGWGYSFNPFDRQVEKLRDDYRIICPDRSGYGGSIRLGELDDLPTDFHYRAAIETLSVMDALGIQRAIFWGHSDGAVISAILGFTAPERVGGLILEAFHLYPRKLRSRELFETLAFEPESLGNELCERFALEFGREHWRKLISSHAKAWLKLAAQSADPADDLYGGRLREISAPTLFIHGELDPRTEPGELEAAAGQIPNAEIRILRGAAHSPHSESAWADQATQIACEFLKMVRSAPGM
ncbi:MAG TPA: alpha/beta hydrolase [Pyrinomonadaceae bacterium]|nr:alpha/beta hydrolase [Pyrinomonadaceae bacterium]